MSHFDSFQIISLEFTGEKRNALFSIFHGYFHNQLTDLISTCAKCDEIAIQK